MRFIFNGTEFRIRFQHDHSKKATDHIGHAIELIRGGNNRGALIRCATCSTVIGGTEAALTASMRKRRTLCSIEFSVGIAAGQKEWMLLVDAYATPNEKAGDQFMKAEGRMVSLDNALNERLGDVELPGFMPYTFLSRAFRKAAWRCYRDSRPITVKITTGPSYQTVKDAEAEAAFNAGGVS